MLRVSRLCLLLIVSMAAVPPASRAADRRVVERSRMVAAIDKAAAQVPDLASDPHFARALAAVAKIPREAFVPRAERARAYLDTPLVIGWGQTISDPFIVAVMTASVRVEPGARVLEIGTGSGYQAAVLSRLGMSVSTIEIVPQLARRAERRLRRMGYSNIAVRAGDGFVGWPEHAPFDAIIVTAGAAEVPAPLLAQLKPGGRLVMPIGPSIPQEQLEVFRKDARGKLAICSLGWAMFVPLTGRGARPARTGLMDQGKPLCYGAPVT